MVIFKAKIAKIEQLEDFDDEYVYDIGIKGDTPYFFGNDILVHNSSYFSTYNTMKDLEEFKDFEWTKENIIELYDTIGNLTNESFPGYMTKAFNCPQKNGEIIRAARELCASKGIFIKKKRYAVMIFDKDSKRKDKNGSPGEVKAMGLDLKRSDTPRIVQDFLSEVLLSVLTDGTEDMIIKSISEFRKAFVDWPGWEKGTPKRVNKLSFYGQAKHSNETMIWGTTTKKVPIPGHVRASLNWNQLKQLNNDHASMDIIDGSKVIVCKLLDNVLKMTSVAYPIDQEHLPEWFKKLPFDHDLMEFTLIDKKIYNLLRVLHWNLSESKNDSSFNDLFSF